MFLSYEVPCLVKIFLIKTQFHKMVDTYLASCFLILEFEDFFFLGREYRNEASVFNSRISIES